MRVALVSPQFPIGSERQRGVFIYHTARELARRIELSVFCPLAVYPRWKFLRPVSFQYSPPDLSYEPPDVAATYLTYSTLPLVARPWNPRLSARALLGPLADFAPDLVLAYWAYPEGRGALLVARRLGIPVVLGVRGSDVRLPPDPLSAWLLRRTLRQADFVVAVSEDLRRRCIALGVASDRVRTIPNGCDTAVFFPRDRQAARAALGLRREAELVLFVGRLVPVKGVRELIQAARLLADERPRLELRMIGDGPLAAELRAGIARYGLDSRVRILAPAPQPEIAQWMAAADVLCLPSHSEGCPNVVLEAQACGRAVVASAVGGVPELLDSESGILTPPGDPQKLAAALREALDRRWDEDAIARRARRGWDRVAEETLEVCRQVLEARRQSR